MQWNFYLSGILYGKFYVKDKHIFVKSLTQQDMVSRKRFTEESDDFLRSSAAEAFWIFLKNKKQYEEKTLRELSKIYCFLEKPFPTAGTSLFSETGRNFQRIFFRMRTESMRF